MSGLQDTMPPKLQHHIQETQCQVGHQLPLQPLIRQMSPFTLSSGDATKRVSVWFKDAAGNFSTSMSATIALHIDTTAYSAVGKMGLHDLDIHSLKRRGHLLLLSGDR